MKNFLIACHQDEVLTTCKAVKICEELEDIIVFRLQALERMPKENNPKNEWTKQEIHQSEGKLIKYFG